VTRIRRSAWRAKDTFEDQMKLLRVPFLLAAMLLLGAVSPLGASAAAPAGAGLDTAIVITGTSTGTLDAHTVRWYQFAGDGSSPAAVTMDYVPADNPLPGNVYFNVNWAVADGQPNADWPGYFRVGQGTPSELPPGTRYWLTAATSKVTYFLKVVNDSDEAIGYALALTGTSFPPASLNPPAPGAPTSVVNPSQPAGPPGPPSVAPTPTPAPVTTQVAANTATDRSGLILDPQVLISGPFSTVLLHVDSSSTTQVHVDRVVITPPPGAVVDAAIPNQSQDMGGVGWFVDRLVDQNDPLTGYFVRFWGTANGAVVRVDWSTSTDKGELTVTISGAPSPAPVGQ
jgi:hypothetical protein